MALLIIVILLLRRRSQQRAVAAWRTSSQEPLDSAHLAAELLPASGLAITDRAHWESVRERVDTSAEGLEKVGAAAPIAEGASAAGSAARALRGLVFALESDRLLRDATVTPTPEQLGEADAANRARRAELDDALKELDRLIRPAVPTTTAAPPR